MEWPTVIASLLLGGGLATCENSLAEPPASVVGAAAPVEAVGVEAGAVLDRAAAVYHRCRTFQDKVELSTSFDIAGPSDSKQHMGAHNLLVFRYTAKPWRFALKGRIGCVYGDEQKFVTLSYGSPDKNGAYHPDYEKAKFETAADGTIDWRDLSGSMGTQLEVDPVSALFMSGPKAGWDLFRKAAEVVPGELDKQAGVWVKGKGLCPYTPGSGGGVDITPISAWFDAKTGELREVRYDISNTSWAQSAAESFGEKHGGAAAVKAEAVVRYADTIMDAVIDEKLITDNKESPVEKVEPARMGGSVPMMGMGGKPGQVSMVPAVKITGGGMAPAASTEPQKTGGADKKTAPAKEAPEVERATDKLLNQPAPAYAGKTPDGADFKSADLKGRVVLMDCWATWCGPCMQAIPKIQQLHEQFKDQGVAVVGINRDKPSDDVNTKVKKVLERKDITFQQVMDTDGAIVKAYKVAALPTLILIDKEGVVRAVHVGYGPDEAQVLADEISKLLKGEKLH